jgi:hypothetical protein
MDVTTNQNSTVFGWHCPENFIAAGIHGVSPMGGASASKYSLMTDCRFIGRSAIRSSIGLRPGN